MCKRNFGVYIVNTIFNKPFIIIDKTLNEILSNKIKVYLVEIYINKFWFTKILVDNEVVVELVLPKIIKKIGTKFVQFENE